VPRNLILFAFALYSEYWSDILNQIKMVSYTEHANFQPSVIISAAVI